MKSIQNRIEKLEDCKTAQEADYQFFLSTSISQTEQIVRDVTAKYEGKNTDIVLLELI